MSTQKVVNKNTNLVTNNVVSRGHLSSSVVPRTLTLGGTADAATADVTLGETAWQFNLLAGSGVNAKQLVTLSIKDSSGADVDPTAAGGVWQTYYNWSNKTHKVICTVGSNELANPAVGTDPGITNGSIKIDASPAAIVVRRVPVTVATGGAAALGAVKVTVSIVERNLTAAFA
jgi:hypothetical protein